MGAETKIAWTDKTFNPWIGCTKVSPGCTNCYAEVDTFTRIQRSQGRELWGPTADRHVVAEAKWREVVRWNQAASDAGVRKRVFCASLADVFEDRPDLEAPRQRLLHLASSTPSLDWQFLSKRPQNVATILSRTAIGVDAGIPLATGTVSWLEMQRKYQHPNWWFGCTVEDMRRAEERIPHLLAIPARVRFLSCEPLLESLDLTPWLATGQIHWVIVGGESHQKATSARPFDLTWAEEIIGQCRQHKVAVFMKQTGSHVVDEGSLLGYMLKKGGDLDQWPEWMRVREFPKLA